MSILQIFLIGTFLSFITGCQKPTKNTYPIDKTPATTKRGETTSTNTQGADDAISLPSGDGTQFIWDGQADKKGVVWEF